MNWNVSNKQIELSERWHNNETVTKTIYTWFPTLIDNEWYWLEYVEVDAVSFYRFCRHGIKFVETYTLHEED